MHSGSFKKTLIVLIVLLALVNTGGQICRLLEQKSSLSSAHPYPGATFLSLRPGLKGVPMAGYFTDRTSTHPSTDVGVMFPYQQAQYALSPTLLDYYHPFAYEWTVFNTKDGIKLVRNKAL